MNSRLTAVYDRAPVFVQNWMITAFSASLHRRRYMGRFPEFRELLDRMQWSSPSEVGAWQDERLADLVRHAYDTVPYYRRLFEERGLKPADVSTREDLRKLPLLTKEQIKERFYDLLTGGADRRRLVTGHTSGTTGTPLTVAYDAATVQVTYAALDRQYTWAGCRLARGGDRIAVVRGNPIVPMHQNRPPFWRYNRFHNQLLLSAFHLSETNLDSYFRQMEEFGPVALDGYPSTLYVLARYLLGRGRTFPLRAVISSSETLYDFQREAAEKAFECKIFDYYALAERTVFATECDRHDGHHLCDEYGISEIVDEQGVPLPPGSTGRLVSTGLHNRTMPLIRYVTNDLTAMKTKPCSCGRGLARMEDVTTKAEDTLTLRDGRLISPSTLTHPFKPLPLDSIRESQIHQTDLDHVQVKIVPGPGFSKNDEHHLRTELAARLGTDTHIEIVLLDELPRLPSGKLRWVVSDVPFGLS